MMKMVLISACLLGQAVRFDGKHKNYEDAVLLRWLHENRIVPFCPEVAGGLPVPRLRAEIADSVDGFSVIDGMGKVVDVKGRNITTNFVKGAERALAMATASTIEVAVLKEGSPSCGSKKIYDGTFSGRKIPGAGVTTALLRRSGVYVFSEFEFLDADRKLKSLESAASSSNDQGG